MRERQAAVAELAPRVDLREDLAVLGAEARRAVDSRSLAEWAAAAPVPVPPGLRLAGALASTAAFATLAGWGLGLWGSLPFYLAAGLVLALALLSRSVSDRVLGTIGRPAHDLQALTDLFDRLGVSASRRRLLARLHAALLAEGQPPGRPIAQLRRWLEVHDSKRNVFFAPVAFLLLWDLQLAGAVERWRRRFGRATLAWLSVLGELEALVSLASYAFENPEDPYPGARGGGPALARGGPRPPAAPGVPLRAQRRAPRRRSADAGGHGLQHVREEHSAADGRNQRGAGPGRRPRPGRSRLRMSPLAVGASIRVQDSLQDGESRFYAEIKRIRQVMDHREGRHRPPSSCSTRSSTARTRPSGGWGRRPWCARSSVCARSAS